MPDLRDAVRLQRGRSGRRDGADARRSRAQPVRRDRSAVDSSYLSAAFAIGTVIVAVRMRLRAGVRIAVSSTAVDAEQEIELKRNKVTVSGKRPGTTEVHVTHVCALLHDSRCVRLAADVEDRAIAVYVAQTLQERLNPRAQRSA